VVAILAQLERSQWMSADELARLQRLQLSSLLAHAHATVPFYRERLLCAGYTPGARATPDVLAAVPPLSRAELQGLGDALLATPSHEAHRPIGLVRSSGSTGIPVQVRTTRVTKLLWDAITLRDHYWHRRDFAQKLVAIRAEASRPTDDAAGVAGPSWGPPVSLLHQTGPAALLDVSVVTERQLPWLIAQVPAYLLTYPSNAVALAKLCLARGVRLPTLRELRLFGEVVDDDVRAVCGEAWGVPVTDLYSANEIGYIALQCEHGAYHVQSESVLLEVVDASGAPCAPGDVGRVVVTSLHNFAMPLIRYELGDFAEVGAGCRCGRGLPVLARILGRTRNMLVMPDGTRRWPLLGWREFRKVAPVVQHQMVQRSRDLIEVRLVVERPLTAAEEDRLGTLVQQALGHRFPLTFSYLPEIPRTRSRKYEEFVCEVA
jgi:phenylacetate-CoA ligase